MFHIATLLVALCLHASVRGEIEENTINEDGSYTFRHSNDDIGSYYHSASGTADNIVRGRYGSRSPATGQVEEVVYTAGPRGFRANGPRIHRKMDLAQYPVRPLGSADDPLADPYDDPSYSFSFRASDHSRSESSDSSGRVRGLYSYLDDVGERHSVRYAAGAGTGFEVLNAVPDNPASVAYAAPLYKAHPNTRGKMTTQRGPDGTYKLIAAGPDHRRAESRSPDGFVRGTYSYLDDTGVQRTVEYIAGPGIGYRIVKNRMGPGTHINPSIADFRLSDRDFKLANEFGRGAGATGSFEGAGGSSIGSSAGSAARTGGGVGGGGTGGGAGAGGSRTDGGYLTKSSSGSGSRVRGKDGVGTAGDRGADRQGEGSSSVAEGSAGSRVKSDRMGSYNRGATRYGSGSGGGGSGGSGSGGGGSGSSSAGSRDADFDIDSGAGGASGSAGSNGGGSGGYDYSAPRNRGKVGGGGSGSGSGGGGGSASGGRGNNRNSLSGDERSRNRDRTSSSAGAHRGSSKPGGGSSRDGSGGGYHYEQSSSADNYNLKDDDVGSLPPLVTSNRKILEVDRERDWVQRHRDSTVIKNVGKWYIGLPPGHSVRAHVQNIDLLPLGGRRVPSPSEALRQDEIADMMASVESGTTDGS